MITNGNIDYFGVLFSIPLILFPWGFQKTTVVSNRGKADYFHGRKQEIDF